VRAVAIPTSGAAADSDERVGARPPRSGGRRSAHRPFIVGDAGAPGSMKERTMTDTQLDAIHWRGINHLALVTTDMDATVRFYHGVLGARLVTTIGTPTFRHYFFEFGPQQTVAFFEYTDVELESFATPAGIPDARKAQFDHLSFNVPDEEALMSLRARLKANDCEVTDVVDHNIIHSVYFTDPNGIALEASCWLLDATGRTPDYQDERFFADPDPVPAVREIRETGSVQSVPHTRLV
jgi:catechol 2,3-dioxygenase-like lactoylglutathione lyase family enzyme